MRYQTIYTKGETVSVLLPVARKSGGGGGGGGGAMKKLNPYSKRCYNESSIINCVVHTFNTIHCCCFVCFFFFFDPLRCISSFR